MNLSFFTNLDPDVYRVLIPIFLLMLLMQFLRSMLRKILDHKLKNRIIDKGVSKELAASLLQSDEKDEKTNSFKWFLILLSTGIGLFITGIFPSLGIHSFAIMAISISIGFLAYSFYLKNRP